MRQDPLLDRLADESREALAFLGDETKTRSATHADLKRLVRALLQRSEPSLLLACHDRYHAALGVLSCWAAGRLALFPPTLRADAVQSVRDRHPGAWVVSDQGEFGTALPSALLGTAADPLPRTRADAGRVLATVYTSGSTGDPVGCDKSAEQLVGEAEYLARLFDFGPHSRVLASAPPHHLYGLLFGVLVPLCAGGASVRRCSPLPASLTRSIREHRVDTLCAVPPHLAGLLSVEPREIACLKRVFCSAGRLDSELSVALERRFSLQVIEIFGSSETGGIAYRTEQNPRWRPFDGVSVSEGVDGALLVDSPFLPAGSERPFRSSDRIELHPDGSFSHLGRLDDVVKIGGERVSVQEVEKAIRRLPGVRDAAVIQVAVPGPRQWELWASVVLSGVDGPGLFELLGGVLQPVAVPKRVKLVQRLPRETSGKISRQRLLELFEDDSG